MTAAFLMDGPVSLDQVHTAARALGFSLDILEPGRVAGREAPLQEATVLLAVLDAIILRWQVDQDLRDPSSQHTRRTVALFAQTAVSSEVGEALAAALRRLQTVSGLLATPAQGDGSTYPGHAAHALVGAATSLVAAWITTYALEQPPAGVMTAQAGAALSHDTVRALADRAEDELHAAAAAVRAWRSSRDLA